MAVQAKGAIINSRQALTGPARSAAWIWGVILAALILAPEHAQAAAYHVPRTAGGDPDLQGSWSIVSMTHLERPSKVAHLKLSEAEAVALEAYIVDRRTHPKDDPVGQAGTEWMDSGHLARIGGVARSSWIVDPANGTLPFNAAGKAMQKRWDDTDFQGFDNPEDRPTGERCLMGPGDGAGPPLLNTGHLDNFKIVQTRGVFAILSEANHVLRIVRLGGAHPPAQVRPWGGDSIGHFEGDVLVVETTNFNPRETNHDQYQLSPDAVVTERFWRGLAEPDPLQLHRQRPGLLHPALVRADADAGLQRADL